MLRSSLIICSLLLLACSKYSGSVVSDKKPDIRDRIVETARKYKGSDYRYGARGPQSFDCSGFTYFVYKKHGITLLPVSREQAKAGSKVSMKAIKPADLIFFKHGSKIDHVAMVTSRKGNDIRIIHSTTSRGVIEESLTSSDYWTSRLSYAKSIVD